MSQILNLTSQISAKAIIVAGGTGTRMQSPLLKQFILLNGRPLLFYTIETFYGSAYSPEIILVLHPDFHDYWRNLCKEYSFKIPHKLVEGGNSRFQSVKNGLDTIADTEAIIAVHDAVRPLTGKKIIDEAYTYAAENGNAVVAVQSRDSVRQLKDDISTALVRSEIYLVQTPQTFKASQLHEAYRQPFSDDFTDDASVVERAGFNINLIEGSYTNLKITYPEDIAIAELLLNKKPSA
ncbi:2-C-methyl-D-erythritol 4-phosphate cytidylyltransferase [Mucilaginibacter limnophilus]|uniref:2-C-methyl-D-erythritol 4-phosphate cytidylyltransferase n=1 Tax=Mucilaginibacter limnophilus TaxID=1932778 RepID=A0A437MK26_9SPHI|nr:2-C-methyl-D-erythritol 4-phosphate cytidylyltransferase [Mucilaginibacter limnophilus]RVT98034.1 2-C-methyl-D-erythritol 4-phosphate cytidylyltransferase [Mucilaginibacter limnophilus]